MNKSAVIFLWIIFCSPFHAMLSDGIHPPKDYVKFVETQKAFKASCFIYDDENHTLQTGVLIAPDIVMTAAHGFEGKIDLKSITIGFGETVSLEGKDNYQVIAYRTHPRYHQSDYPAKSKYDIIFFKLAKPVKGIDPVPLFEEKILDDIPPLFTATFGSADIPYGGTIHRRAFVLPETEIFSLMGRDPEALYDHKTVMMGSIFFEPLNVIKPVKRHGPEKELRTYYANKRWHEMGEPPYALALAGSSGAPVFINLEENGAIKTYVFGMIQSFSHISTTSFKYSDKMLETQRLLRKDRSKIYGKYQTVFCVPYKLSQRLQAYKHNPNTYQLSRHVKAILKEFQEKKPTADKNLTNKTPNESLQGVPAKVMHPKDTKQAP
jgi:hypothetical protein